jgi:hypothetical protein
MPSASEPAKKGKTIVSAYDSETFDADVSIHVDGFVGSATISPSNRDIALASYVDSSPSCRFWGPKLTFSVGLKV